MSLPAPFLQQMRDILPEELEVFCDSLEMEPPISIRLNGRKEREAPVAERIGWTKRGYYLNQRPVFTLDPLFHAGTYYVQEASSMFIEQAIGQLELDGEECVALDLCAAPGGKTTLLADSLSDNSLIVANEVIRGRSNILSENAQKWGSGNILVTNNDPKELGKLRHCFDLVLVDAPCSGEGMFRKDKNARNEWSGDNVELCAQRQQRILSDIWHALKPGGYLIYSTCTFNRAENEENLKWLCDEHEAEHVSIDASQFPEVTTDIVNGVGGYRFYPHKTKGEGFFMAIVRKSDDEPQQRMAKNRRVQKMAQPDKVVLKEMQQWLKQPGVWQFLQQGDEIVAIPKNHSELVQRIMREMRVVYPCLIVGEEKKRKLKPNHALSMSIHMNSNAFCVVELSLSDALKYLKREVLTITDVPDGWILLTYKKWPIGFGKKIKQRVNNNYPKEWRIRMSIPNTLVEEK